MIPPQKMSRRSFIKLSSVSLVGLSLGGCCDETPSLDSPVFWGFKEFSTLDGAPVALRVFYPTIEGTPENAKMYADCGKYPLIMFLHGEYTTYKSWIEIPMELARAGFIVVVPDTDSNPGWVDGALLQPANVVGWMRRNSPYSPMLSDSLGLCGHSYGAIKAGALAATMAVNAFASLDGPWMEWQDSVPTPLERLNTPSLFVLGTDLATDSSGSTCTGGFDLDCDGRNARVLWNLVGPPKHNLKFYGAEHFDYVPSDSEGLTPGMPRGSCGKIAPLVASAFFTTFFSKYMAPPVHFSDDVPDTLIIPALQPTPEETYFAGGFLPGFSLITGSRTCAVTQSWVTNNPVHPTGSITLGGNT